jgi:hypothetical protein
VAKSSSANKVAKLAEKGRGKKVRFQGGTLFPVVVAAIMVLGIALVAYSRSASYADAPGPNAADRDHYHIAFGIYLCDQWLPNIVGERVDDEEYRAFGVHSHDDGVIHYHPITGAASGRNAKLGVYLDIYDIELSDDKLVIPADQPWAQSSPGGTAEGLTIEEGKTKCTVDGKEVDGQLKVAVWDQATDAASSTVLTSRMNGARVKQDGMAMGIYFVPAGTEDLPETPTASRLTELGSIDGGPTTPIVPDGGTVTTIAGATDTTVAGGSDTTVASSDSSAVTTTLG